MVLSTGASSDPSLLRERAAEDVMKFMGVGQITLPSASIVGVLGRILIGGAPPHHLPSTQSGDRCSVVRSC